jgi:hypothetical protein
VALCALASARGAGADPFEQLPVASEEELADLRGGLLVHVDGLELRIAIGLETRVDDQVLLRTSVGTEDLLRARGAHEADTTGGSGPRMEAAGDPNGTQVFHWVGPADLSAVVRNRLDGVSIETIGRMEIEVPNFGARGAAIRDSLAAQGVSDMLNDAAILSIQR